MPIDSIARRKRLREVFDKYDADRSGDVDISELKNIFRELAVNKTEEQLLQILRTTAAQRRKNGGKTVIRETLTFEEFEALFSVARLHQVFDSIDKDKSGEIDMEELQLAMHKLGHKFTQKQCAKMMSSVDTDHSGQVSFDEFVAFFENVPNASLESVAQHWASSAIITDVGSDMSAQLPTPGLEWWQMIVTGGISGVTARTVTAPLEKVKIAAQTGRLTSLVDGKHSVVGELFSTYSKQGIRGMFAGNMLNCLRSFPTNGLATLLYAKFLALTPADDEFDMMEPVYRLACGGAAALVANTLTYPMDLVRARLTVSGSSSSSGSGSGSSSVESGNSSFKRLGVMEAIRDIARSSRAREAAELAAERTEGGGSGFRRRLGLRLGLGSVSGFYQGLRPTLLAIVPFIAIQNTTVDLLGCEAHHRGIEGSPALYMSIGAVAGMLSQLIVYPLDLMRRRIQVGAELHDVLSDSTARGKTTQRAKQSWTASPEVISERTWMSRSAIAYPAGMEADLASIRIGGGMMANPTHQIGSNQGGNSSSRVARQYETSFRGMFGGSFRSFSSFRALYAGIVPTFLKTIPSVAIVAGLSQLITKEFQEHNEKVQAAASATAVTAAATGIPRGTS